MNKKGLELLGKYTVGIFIGILCLVVLFILVGKLYTSYTQESDLEKARGNIVNIRSEIEALKLSDRIESDFISVQAEDWYLASYPSNGIVHPEGECLAKDSCLCMCNKANCEGQKACQGFDFKVEVDGSIKNLNNVIELDESILGLKLIEDGEDIKIRK